jgi:hypothetical protein
MLLFEITAKQNASAFTQQQWCDCYKSTPAYDVEKIHGKIYNTLKQLQIAGIDFPPRRSVKASMSV